MTLEKGKFNAIKQFFIIFPPLQLFDYEIINEKLLKIMKIWFLEKEYFHLIFEVALPKDVKAVFKTQTQLVSIQILIVPFQIIRFICS